MMVKQEWPCKKACFPDIGYVVEACAIKHSQPRPSPRLGYAVAAQAITQNPWTVHVRYAEDPVHAFKVHAIAGPEQPQPAPEEPAADDPAADVPAAEVPAVEEPVPVSQEELAALQAQLQVVKREKGNLTLADLFRQEYEIVLENPAEFAQYVHLLGGRPHHHGMVSLMQSTFEGKLQRSRHRALQHQQQPVAQQQYSNITAADIAADEPVATAGMPQQPVAQQCLRHLSDIGNSTAPIAEHAPNAAVGTAAGAQQPSGGNVALDLPPVSHAHMPACPSRAPPCSEQVSPKQQGGREQCAPPGRTQYTSISGEAPLCTPPAKVVAGKNRKIGPVEVIGPDTKAACKAFQEDEVPRAFCVGKSARSRPKEVPRSTTALVSHALQPTQRGVSMEEQEVLDKSAEDGKHEGDARVNLNAERPLNPPSSSVFQPAAQTSDKPAAQPTDQASDQPADQSAVQASGVGARYLFGPDSQAPTSHVPVSPPAATQQLPVHKGAATAVQVDTAAQNMPEIANQEEMEAQHKADVEGQLKKAHQKILDLERALEAQSSQVCDRENQVAEDLEHTVAAAAKKRELEIAAESGHQVKKARTREPLSDAVENGEGAPKRCMQAMQCAGCLERDVCIAIMSQWLKPEQERACMPKQMVAYIKKKDTDRAEGTTHRGL